MLETLYCRQHSGAPEICLYIDTGDAVLSVQDRTRIRSIVVPHGYTVSQLPQYKNSEVVEIGPQLSFETAFSANATASLRNAGVPVARVERSVRYPLRSQTREEIIAEHCDSMLEIVYPEPLTSFKVAAAPEPLVMVPVLAEGAAALVAANKDMSLGLDPDDIPDYARIYANVVRRDATDAELAFFANARSDHSQHHTFRGVWEIDGVVRDASLFDLIRAPYLKNPGNNLVAFHDNGGVIAGGEVDLLVPEHPGKPSRFVLKKKVLHLVATAETHNHPTMFAPFPGAATGVGGRIRDNRAVGRGALVHAGVAGYTVGSLESLRPKNFRPLQVPGIARRSWKSPHATPLEVITKGSEGVADYGNKVGEPLLGGFAREFAPLVGCEDVEPIKPVLYTGGVGFISQENLEKHAPQKGMLVVMIGGPTYRIGLGGGAASSAAPGATSKEMNLQSVQRDDAETANRANRVLQLCAEMGDNNPIQAIHDQGAGGILNVLTELVGTEGAELDFAKVALGDQTLSDREIGSAESQERYGLLLWEQDVQRFQVLCARERVTCEVLGRITGDGRFVVRNSARGTTPVDLPLGAVLEEMPRKRYVDVHIPPPQAPLVLPQRLGVPRALQEIFWLLQVGSKDFKLDKADTSVTGLVALQPRVGPLQIPLADCGVLAASHYSLRGIAEAVGENANRFLLNPRAAARMAVAEMLANMGGAKITSHKDIACRVNWMWPAKLRGEGAALYDAVEALPEFLMVLGIAANGGKDSLSMAVKVGEHIVRSPRQAVVLGYAPMLDVRRVVTPVLAGNSRIGVIDVSQGKRRLGGSAFAQAMGQLGDDVPDIDNPALFLRAFKLEQMLLDKGLISAYHDVSDGGIVTTLAEMCFAGNCGAHIDLDSTAGTFPELFAEEMRMVVEVPWGAVADVESLADKTGVPLHWIGQSSTQADRSLVINCGRHKALREDIGVLRGWWERKSNAIKQCLSTPAAVEEEARGAAHMNAVPHHLSFEPKRPVLLRSYRPAMGVLREEGTNGDRELAAAFHHAGFEVFDIAMSDIRSGRVTALDHLRGVAFAGGFSFADVWGSARGWAAGVRYNVQCGEVFRAFFERNDTFSFGVCNGFQLMPLIGLPLAGLDDGGQPYLAHNYSGQFESRWVGVRVLPSPAIFTRSMVGSTLGIWVAHGEGRLVFPNARAIEVVKEQRLAPLAYVGPGDEQSEDYPYNPNGSLFGWAGLCSPCGRHFGLMPHPERCVQSWESPWMPPEWRGHEVGPWMEGFSNLYHWSLGDR